jgi:hypothetical protein
MEGVEDHSVKPPLVVLDGANVAYAYAEAKALQEQGNGGGGAGRKLEPDARGIRVACRYFQEGGGVRVLVVLPASWFRSKPRDGDPNRTNAAMETDRADAIRELKERGLLVASPPADDDDAYAITIARRECGAAIRRNRGDGYGYVLSNDMFRDAAARDPTRQLQTWLQRGLGGGGDDDGGNNFQQGKQSSLSAALSSSASASSSSQPPSPPLASGPGRISFAFCDMGVMDDHGDRELSIVPNPRHLLVAWIEHRNLHHHLRGPHLPT